MLRPFYCLFEFCHILLNSSQLLICQFYDLHETFDCFTGLDQLCSFIGDEERTFDAGHPIETRSPVGIPTQPVFSQDRHVGATPPRMKKSRIGEDASTQRSRPLSAVSQRSEEH